MKKRIISIFLLIVIVMGVATTAIVSSLASDTEDELYDYAKFEVDYLMNRVEYNGDILNGSANVYDMVIKDDFFNHDFYEYLQDHPVLREITVTQVQLYDNDINLIAHPEHFYSVVLMDILQSQDLQDLSKDSLKSTVSSDVDRIIQMTFAEDCDNLIDNLGIKNVSQLKAATLGDLPNETINKIVDNIADVTSAHIGVKDLSGILGYALDIYGSVENVVNKIDSLYAIAGYNLKAIEALMQISYRTDDPYLKMAANDIIGIYSEMDSADEVAEIMSIAGQTATGYAVDKLLYYSTKFAVGALCTAVGNVLVAWDVGTSIANICFKVNDLNTGYFLVEAATVVEDVFRRYLSSCSDNYLSSGSLIDAERCRTAYKLVLTTQYYSNEIMRELGYTIANNVAIWSAIRSLFGCASYQDVEDICNSTRNIIEQRYYNWVALAQKMYKTIYGVSFSHAISLQSTPVSSISFKTGSYTLFVNEGVCNTATAYPTNAVDREVYYSSSDPSVATVNSYGNIVAVSHGETTITAYTLNGTKATCKITVLPYKVSLIDDERYRLDKYIGGAIAANIPSASSTGVPVTSIADNAFEGSSVTSVTIPDSVTSIGDSAFAYCNGLISIEIGDGVTIIRGSAFDCCDSLMDVYYTGDISGWCAISFGSRSANPMYYAENVYLDGKLIDGEVIIPDSVTSIGDYTFSGCTGLKSISIGSGVTYIGDFAFFDCFNLACFTVDSDNPTYLSDECGVLFNKDKTYIVQYPIDNPITAYVIPDTVVGWGQIAFAGCKGIEELSIPVSAPIYDDNYLNARAFKGCTVKKIIITVGNGTENEWPRVVHYDYTPWYITGCSEIVIEDGVKCIDEGMFRECTELISVTIGNSVTLIGISAFEYCTSLVNITIPDSVTEIGSCSFMGCESLESISIPDSVKVLGGTSFYECYNLKNVKLGNGITQIECATFAYCHKLESIIIPDSVTYIDGNAFRDCTGLKELTMPISAELYNDLEGGILFTRYASFQNCTEIEKITLTKGSGNAQNYYYQGNPNIVYYINTPWYISGCSTVVIEEGVTDIGDYTFSHCKELTSVFIRDGVRTIGENAFEYCIGLTEVSLPNTLMDVYNGEGIRQNAFYGCTGLSKVCFNGTEEQWWYTSRLGGNSSLTSVAHCVHNHSFDWEIISEPTFTETGFKTGICTVCDGCTMCNGVQEVELPEITLSNENVADVDYLSNFVSGFDAGSTSISDYFAITNEGYSVVCDDEIIATGSVIRLSDSQTVISEFTAVIFGDVNSDGWYDGMDAVIVSCLANGMLPHDDVSEAVYMAADCNHDGVIDQLDVDLLNQAGALLANVDQSKSAEVLLETSSAYVKYLDLIDQSFEIDVEDEEDSTTPDTEENVEETEPSQDNFFSFILDFVEFFKQIFNFILEFINN